MNPIDEIIKQKHKNRIEQLRKDWIIARSKGQFGRMKFIEKLAKLHKKEL